MTFILLLNACNTSKSCYYNLIVMHTLPHCYDIMYSLQLHSILLDMEKKMDKMLSILLVEDEALVMMGLRVFIKQLGHTVIAEAYDGESAIELALSMLPDLIIMDVKMPKLDGIQALEQINSKGEFFPCIFVTAHSDKRLIQRATQAGAFSYLIKPVSIDSLRAAIEVAAVRYEEFKLLQHELDDAKTNLQNRKFIERAKGILMDKNDCRESEAMQTLQKISSDTNKKLVDVAKDIIKNSSKEQ